MIVNFRSREINRVTRKMVRTSIYIYIYIYIERERERENKITKSHMDWKEFLLDYVHVKLEDKKSGLR